MRVIFSKTDALGDQLWATGTIAALLEHRPSAHVIWLVREGYEAVHTLLDGSHVFRADRLAHPAREAERLFAQPRSESPSPWSRVTFVPLSLNAYAPHPSGRDLLADTNWWLDFVRALHADCAIAGTSSVNWVDQAMVWGSGAPIRVGYEPSAGSQLLPPKIAEELRSRSLATSFTSPLPFGLDPHEGERLANLIEPLTGSPGYAAIRLQLGHETVKRAAPRPLIVLAPGAGDPKRIYPTERMAAAIAMLPHTNGTPNWEFLILQGPQDSQLCAQLTAELTQRGVTSQTIELDPRDLRQACALLACARLLICNESFWVHLASAIGTPTVAVWGLGHWRRFTPRQGHVTVMHTEMLCQNCNWLCCFPLRHCITDLPSAELSIAAQKRLRAGEAQSGVEFRSFPPLRPPTIVRESLYLQAKQSETLIHERNLLQAQLADLQHNFDAAEADRLARGDAIEKQGRDQALLHQEIDLRLKELHELQITAEALRNERNLLQAQLADLRHNFDTAEADRLARGDAIQKQGREQVLLHQEIDLRLKELHELQITAEALRNERNLLQAQLADLQHNFDASEADRIARGNVIEQQGQKSVELHRLVWLTEQNRDWWKAEAERKSQEVTDRQHSLQLRIGALEHALTGREEELSAIRHALQEHLRSMETLRSRWWFRLAHRLGLQ